MKKACILTLCVHYHNKEEVLCFVKELLFSLWRTVKYDEVHLHDYRIVSEAKERLGLYFHFYNTERLHKSLGYRTPYEVYFRVPCVGTSDIQKAALEQRV